VAEVTPLVYTKIAAVSAALAKEGIGKTRKNAQQGYQFRGIDDVLNALAPLLSANGLVILPRVLSREMTERESKSGGVLFSVVVFAAFDFVAAEDGSMHTVQTYGEAMDSADKATNKAMSACYKYAAFLAFCIPTEGDNDADATTPEAGARTAATTPTQVHRATISDAQQKRFFAIAREHGWSGHEVQSMLKREANIESSAQIQTGTQYERLCKLLEQGVDAKAAAV